VLLDIRKPSLHSIGFCTKPTRLSYIYCQISDYSHHWTTNFSRWAWANLIHTYLSLLSRTRWIVPFCVAINPLSFCEGRQQSWSFRRTSRWPVSKYYPTWVVEGIIVLVVIWHIWIHINDLLSSRINYIHTWIVRAVGSDIDRLVGSSSVYPYYHWVNIVIKGGWKLTGHMFWWIRFSWISFQPTQKLIISS
jgi:hypothetical protein